MRELIQTLTEIPAPPGHEKALREKIHKLIKPFVDDIQVDALGNLIARKGNLTGSGKRIMLAAHMDEIGLIASHIDEMGFVRFTSMGTAFGKYLPGGRVRFINGVEGVIGTELMEPFHETPSMDKMYIDVGANRRKDCPVGIGDVASFVRPFVQLGDRLIAKALDDRAGVAVLIETLRTLKASPHEIYFVFTSQEEVGTRGAGPAAYRLDPEIAIVIDVTPAEDTPHHPRPSIALGQGPAIKIRDPHTLADPRIVEWMIRTAEKSRIPYQREVLLLGGTDLRAIQFARSGVAVGAVCIPCRYVHSPSEMVDFEDLKNSVRLLKSLLGRLIR